MKRTAFWLVLLLGASLAEGSDVVPARDAIRTGFEAAVPPPDEPGDERYGHLSLSFEPNVGQFHKDVRFFTRGPGYQLFLTAKEAVFVFTKRVRYENEREKETGLLLPERSRRPADRLKDTYARTIVRMQLEGVSPTTRIVGEDPLPGKVNYFIGNDPKKWRSNIPTYRRVRFEDVYPGINLVYYGNADGRLEYDFEVRPGADPDAIRMAVVGPAGVATDGVGALVLKTAAGSLRFNRPDAYQNAESGRVDRSGSYVLRADGRIGFTVADRDPARTLVIDPVLEYATFLGGGSRSTAGTVLGGDIGTCIAADGGGNAYIGGYTSSSTFPVTPGVFDTQYFGKGFTVGFVTKLNATGTALVYSTYLGGQSSDGDFVLGIAINGGGEAFVTGSTGSALFPTTLNAFKPNGGVHTIFVTRFTAAGDALVYSTVIGGQRHASIGNDAPSAIAVDNADSAFVTGPTTDGTFPTTAGAFQTTTGWNKTIASTAVFVTKVNPSGHTLDYSTFVFGELPFNSGQTAVVDNISNDIVLDAGAACITGWTSAPDFPTTGGAFQRVFGPHASAFVVKVNASGGALVFSTFLGVDGAAGNRIARESSGNLYVGSIGNIGFGLPQTPGIFALGVGPTSFVKLKADGSGIFYATSFSAPDLTTDSSDGPVIVGGTSNTSFPTLPPSAPNSPPGAVVMRLTPDGTNLTFSTIVQGPLSPLAIAVNSQNRAFITGSVSDAAGNPKPYLTTPGVFQPAQSDFLTPDAFVAKLRLPPPVTISGVLPNHGPTLGGTAVTISGTGFLAGATAFIGGVPAPVSSVTPTTVMATTGPHIAGPVDVIVMNTDDSGGMLQNGYTYDPCGVAKPTATLSGTLSICSGNPAILSVALTGTGPWTLYWSDGFVQSGIGSSPATRSVTPSSTTTYAVSTVVDSNCAGPGTGTGTVTVVPAPSAVITAPSALCTLATGVVASVPNGGVGVTYNWSVTNGSITSGQGTPAVTFTVGAASPLLVSVTVSNGSCIVNSSKSIPVGLAHPTATVSGGGTICPGNTTTVQAVLTGTPPWSIAWSDGVVQSGINSSPATRTVSPAVSTAYAVTSVSDATVCSGSASGTASVVVVVVPSAITAPSAVCPGSTGNSASVPNAGAGATYAWSITNGAITGGTGTPSITWTAGASGLVTLNLTVTVSGCVKPLVATVAINPLPTATLSGTQTVCAGSPALLQVSLTGTGTLTVRWSDGAISTGTGSITRTVAPSANVTYTLTSVTDAAGCTGTVSGSATLTVVPSPSATVASGSTVVCAESPVTISVALTGTPPWTISWSDLFVQGPVTTSPATRTVTPADSTDYSIFTVRDATGCSAPGNGSYSVSVGTSSADTTITAPFDVCPGVPAFASVVGTPGLTYAWTATNATIISGATTRQIAFQATPGPGPVVLKVTGAGSGCVRSQSVSVQVYPVPDAPTIAGPAAATSGDTNLVASIEPHLDSTYSWSIMNGIIRSGASTTSVVFDVGVPGATTLTVTETNPYGCPATSTLTIPVDGLVVSRMVPIVLDVIGVGGAHFTSELTLSNPGVVAASADLLYTPATSLGATGGTSITEILPPGGQAIIPDILGYLKKKSPAIRAAAATSQGGTLRVTLRNVPSGAVAFAGARTTAPSGPGVAGLGYDAPLVTPASPDAVYLFGLRESGADRTNLAFLNAGSGGPIDLKVTLFSGLGDGRTFVIPETFTLGPGQWLQLNSGLARAGYANGFARVDRVAGTDPFLAYAVFNDNLTNDGSYVIPVATVRTPGPQILPVLIESGDFDSELVLTNPTANRLDVSMSYTESLSANGVTTGIVKDSLAPFEQKIIPRALVYLRGKGATIGPRGAAAYAGSLYVQFAVGGASVLGFVGARIATPTPGGGGYGFFCSGSTMDEAAQSAAFVFSLRQNATTRSNLAFVNASTNQGPVTLEIQIFDGDTGLAAGAAQTITLLPGGWKQLNAVLAPLGVSNGYARIRRTDGHAPWLAYGVVNDGATPLSGATNDGSFIAMTVMP